MNPELFYWRGSSEVHQDIVAGLKSAGYAIKVLRSLDEILDLLVKDFPTMILVDASSSENEASDRVVELTNVEKLYDLPVLFLSIQADKRSAVLRTNFKKFAPIDPPFTFEAIRALVESGLGKPTSAVAEAETKSEAPAPSKKSSSISAAAAQAAAERVHREKVLKNLDPTRLISSFGGSLLASAQSSTEFDDELLLPDIPSKEEREFVHRILLELTEKNEWLGVHARRVTFVSSAVSNNLAFGPARDGNIRTSAILMNWGLLESAESLVKIDPFQQPSAKSLEALAAAYRRSAEMAKKELRDGLASRTMLAMAALLLDEKLTEHREVVSDAKCALMTELVDRACWSRGAWNPYGAHRAMREIRNSEKFASEPKAVYAVGRVLSEAVASRATLESAPLPELAKQQSEEQAVQDEIELNQAFSDAEKLFGFEKPMSIPIAELKPGMRTARPIVALDDQLILPANVSLDEDLIWRIWQVAAVKPFRRGVEIAPVNSDHEPKRR